MFRLYSIVVTLFIGARALLPVQHTFNRRPRSRADSRRSALPETPTPTKRLYSSPATLEHIEGLVKATPVVLFMKGTPLLPSCGFSATLVQILGRLGVQYAAHDVLADESLRQGIKEYSDWPTIPQLYLNGEFVGGSDIVLELFKSGELLEMIEVAAAS